MLERYTENISRNPDVGIEWPINNPVVSEKDQHFTIFQVFGYVAKEGKVIFCQI